MPKYTENEDKRLVKYLALKTPDGRNRMSPGLYQQMVQNEKWAGKHSWSSWQAHYGKSRDEMNRRIKRYQDKHEIQRSTSQLPPEKQPLARFDPEEDKLLVKYLARMAPRKIPGRMEQHFGRSGNSVYKVLVSNGKKYPWAASRSWNGWRERYVKHMGNFDQEINEYQEKHGINPQAQLDKLKRLHKENRILELPEPEQEEDVDNDDEVDEATAGRGTKRNRHQSDSEVQFEELEVQPAKKRKRTNRKLHGSSPEVDDKEVQASNHERSPLRPNNNDSGSGDPNEELEIEQTIVNVDGALAMERSDDGALQDLQGPSDSMRRPENMTPLPQDVHDKAPQSRTPILPRPRLNTPGPLSEQAGLTQRTLPTPSSVTPRPLPRPHPASSARSALNGKIPRNIPSSAVRSHPPTPPPTNVQSDASVPPLSEHDPPMLSEVAKGKQRAEPSPSPIPFSQNTQSTPNALRTVLNPSTIQKMGSAIESFGQRFDTLTPPRKSLFRSPSESSVSDGPFATSASSPQKPEVVRGLPKARERSFRNIDRVRSRKVIAGQRNIAYKEMQQETEAEFDPTLDPNHLSELSPTSSSPVKKSLKVAPREIRSSGQPKAAPSTSTLNVPGKTKKPTSADAVQSLVEESSRGYAHRTFDAIAPTNPPQSAAGPSKTSNMHTMKPSQHVAQAADVFASTATPIASGLNHDRYILKTSHLPPEPSTASSTFSRVRTSTPVHTTRTQRDRDRRRTFAGFGLLHGLPDINLLAELKAKRTRSNSPTLVWSKGSSDITMLDPESQLLSNTERAVARRGPSRNSVIPVVLESEEADATSISPNQLSPTTSAIIFREGLATVFKRMEKNHGFSSEVVRRTWLQKNMDLQATDKKLLRMRIAAETAANSDEDDDRAQVPPSKIQGTTGRVRNVEEYAHVMQPPNAPATVSQSNYTPPFRSRAGHYRRYLEQGRLGEARQREIDLASRQSTSGSPSTVTPAEPAPVWGKREDEALDEALRTSSEDALRVLAKKFGDKVLRQKSLALLD